MNRGVRGHFARRDWHHGRRMGDEEGAGDAGMVDRLERAFSRAPKTVRYDDYKTTDDFSLWLSGLWTKIQHAHGHTSADRNRTKAEIVKAISSKLSVGPALDAYNRLTEEEQNDYDRLVARLTDEFVDKHEKRHFMENMEYNKRKKGQKLTEFMEVIKRDMGKYSGLPNKVMTGVGLAAVLTPNLEKERQEVRRFRNGMRTYAGKKDQDLKRHLLFHLMEDKDLNWENALSVASRWERANNDAKSGSESSGADSSDDGEEAGAMATKKKSSKKTKSKTDGEKITIAALADQVHENQMQIKGIKTAQERLTSVVGEVKETSDKSYLGIQALAEKMDNLSLPRAQGNTGSPYFATQRQQTQQYRQQPQQPQQPQPNQHLGQPRMNFGATQRGGGVNTFRGQPRNFTWNARNNQARQMRFAYQRQTPQTFTTSSTYTRPTSTIAAMGESELGAEPLAEEEDEEKVTLRMSEFMNLTSLAGVELAEDEIVSAVERENFL